MSDDAKTVQTTMWLMILIQTIGSVDLPGKGNRKLPSPRVYVAIVVAWTVLALIADTAASKFASRAAWALVATGTLLGPFGSRLVSFLESVATLFGNAPTVTTGATGTGTSAPASGTPASTVGSVTSGIASTISNINPFKKEMRTP